MTPKVRSSISFVKVQASAGIGVLGFARGFTAVLTVLGWLWLVGGAAAIVWGLVTWDGTRAVGGFVGLVVGGFLVGVSAIGPVKPRRDRWAALRAADPLRSNLRQSEDSDE